MKTLVLNFHTREDFARAKNWFDNYSAFGYFRSNNEFRCLYFEDENIDALEAELRDELAEWDFENFYFTAD